MQTDLEHAPTGTVFESDVCVIGGGIAGLLLSRQLAGRGFRVNLLEAGGPNLEPRSQDLFKSEMRGVPHHGTTEGRLRTFGGASTRWGGQLLSYSPDVFIGWPITEKEIAPYYPEIFRVMGANDLPFDDTILDRFGNRAAVQSPDIRVRLSKFAPFSRRNLAQTIGRECLVSGRITVYFHANAISVDLTPDGASVQSIAVGNYVGARFAFKARHYVVCTGTIETSRLLLSSRSIDPRGIGNTGDQVGRYFHDHLTARVLELGPQPIAVFEKYFAPYYLSRTLHSPKLEATPALREKLGLPQIMAHFFIHEEDDNEFSQLRQALVKLQHGHAPVKRLSQVPSLISGAVQMAYALKVRGRRMISRAAEVTLNIDTEQKPRADSRILISDKLNAVGIPETIVDWKTSPDEGEAMRRYASAIDGYLRSLGMTGLTWKPGLQESADAWLSAASDILHPMGGTRMGESPQDSVVDRNLRVHGVANLHVASCSVFPSGGSSNPTFTLMALACRLADHLQQQKA